MIEGDLAGLSSSQASSRSGSGAELGLRDPKSNTAGFGIPRITETSDLWVRKLGDDGMSYYYQNKINGETRWTTPELDITSSHNELPARKRAGTTTATTPSQIDRLMQRNAILLPTRQRAGSATSQIRPLPRITAINRASIHSDDSDIYPIARERTVSQESRESSREGSISGHSAPASQGKRSPSPERLQSLPEMTSTERLAQLLQSALEAPPPELITDLSVNAQAAIGEVLRRIHLGDKPPLPDELTMDRLIRSIVLAVRNLIYVAAVSQPQIPSHLIPREARERRHTTATQTLLKVPQRKVTATLAKLVLAARSMRYNSGPTAPTTPSRIKHDAEELDRSIVAFVQEVQRCVHLQVQGVAWQKRLFGTFPTVNIGLGLVGAGAAGSWKGLGWVALDEHEEAPGRILGAEVAAELDTFTTQIKDKFSAFHSALSVLPGTVIPCSCSRFI